MQEANDGYGIGDVVMSSSPPVMIEMDADMEDNDVTPRPNKCADANFGQVTPMEGVDCEDEEPFKTPLVLTQKKHQTVKILWDSDEETETVRTKVSLLPVLCFVINIVRQAQLW